MDNRIGVDVKGDLNLRYTSVRWGNANKLEVAEKLVITDELTLSLEYLDLNGGLEIRSSGEN